MQREKKFFAPELKTYGNDLSKRWRVEWWVPTVNGRGRRANPIYGDINQGNTIEERTRRGFIIINSLDFNKAPKKTILDETIDRLRIRLRSKTIKGYVTIVETFTRFLKNNSPESATEETVNQFLSILYNTGINPNTISKYRISLHAVYNHAIKFKLTGFNPVTKVPGIKKQPRSLHYFSDSQIQQIINYPMFPQMWLAIRLLFYCFIRPKEMRGLKIGDINFEYGFIEVPGDISKNKKTEKVSIPDHFLQEIQHLKQYPNNFLVISKSLVPGLLMVGENHLNYYHAKILDALQIRGRYAFYSWKHTGVVKAVRAGINIKDIQLQLRHHSLDMVNEYLKNLGVMDSEDLRERFPVLGGNVEQTHKSTCTATIEDNYRFCPGCGVKLKPAA